MNKNMDTAKTFAKELQTCAYTNTMTSNQKI